MNIFYLDHNTVECAKMHVDKHCVKMILEYAQLLSTAHHILDDESELSKQLYKQTHKNHPSAVWVRQSDSNYKWLYTLLTDLCDEYTHRYNKVHATTRLLQHLKNVPENIAQQPFTEPTPAMPDEYKIAGDSIRSYRAYYNGDKHRMFAWKNRSAPEWVIV